MKNKQKKKRIACHGTKTLLERIPIDAVAGVQAHALLDRTKEQIHELEVLTEELDRPRLVFADAMLAKGITAPISDLAVILKANGIDTSYGLLRWFREHGYLVQRKGERYNMPTEDSLDMGVFVAKKEVCNNPDGTTDIVYTPMLTGKGLIYFVNLFLQEGAIK